MAGSSSVSNFYGRQAKRFRKFLGTYHVNDGTDNLVDLADLGCLGGHVASSENRKGGGGGLEGIAKSGSPQRGADSLSRSKSSNPTIGDKKAG